MKEIVIAIITTTGIIVAAYFSLLGLRSSKRAEKTAEKVKYELGENGGDSALDKIQTTITKEIETLHYNIDERLNSFDRRFDTFDRRASNATDRFNRIESRTDERDKTILRLIDEIQAIRKITDKLKES